MTYAHEERDGNPPGVVPSTVKHEASRSASGWNPASSPYHTADRSLLREESSPVQNSPRHKPVQNISRGYRHASIDHDAISSPQRSVRVYQPLGDYADETTLASSPPAACSREDTDEEKDWYSTDPYPAARKQDRRFSPGRTPGPSTLPRRSSTPYRTGNRRATPLKVAPTLEEEAWRQLPSEARTRNESLAFSEIRVSGSSSSSPLRRAPRQPLPDFSFPQAPARIPAPASAPTLMSASEIESSTEAWGQASESTSSSDSSEAASNVTKAEQDAIKAAKDTIKAAKEAIEAAKDAADTEYDSELARLKAARYAPGGIYAPKMHLSPEEV
jgi:hypothetical protein